MAQRLIVGIYAGATSDPKQLEAALASQKIDASRVKVVTRSAPSQERQDETPIAFVVVAEEMESNDFSDDLTHGVGILTDSGGTNVPGIDDAPPRGLEPEMHGGDNYLAGFAIADDEVDNYNDAIEDGRAVVIVQGGDDEAAGLESSFKAAGLRNVRVF
ncbi:MAG: hypothetical protein ACLQPV_11895 [Vulcanimicrobiaceae bacterium]